MTNPSHLNKTWGTIGTFDGVHLGHQFLIGQLVKKAHGAGRPAVVFTFWPHPSVFFHRTPVAHLLTSCEERSELIKKLGVDEVITLDFDQALADLEASTFMEKLKQSYHLERLFIGPNFVMGKGRTGSIQRLEEDGKLMDIAIEVALPYQTDQGMISSSKIRSVLRKNRIKEANQMLGRPYAVSGNVVHGEHRGTKMGIPTANLEIPAERLLPGNGVYITRAIVDGKTHASVTNIGVRPTFENPLPAPRVEPHLLDMEDQLYGRHLTLEFINFLRPEMKFANSGELVAQIQKDIAATREVFSHEN